ncbi:MAG: ATP-binding cassette domain-containing protein, partial [Dehalococcoidia bacterium]|nr:ATP-binding cassette domain-containing protein [Dehalococcoidia bacterium]
MALELRGIRKRFGSVVANDGISLRIEAGEIHGLLGENGAGKSTLVKILSGFLTADEGEVELHGQRLDLRSPREAIAAGIGILHQEPLVFLPFTAVDNFIAGAPGGLRLRRAEARAALLKVCAEFGFEIDPDAVASTLTIGERQQLEIARLIWLGARILIFDEPTTAISEAQRQRLFATLRRLAADGMSVIFVSHKLEEVADLCERVTVLQHGRVAGERTLPVPAEELVTLMFGRAVEAGTRPEPVLGAPRLRLDGVSAREASASISDVTLEVAHGEVIGIAGLEGAGQRVLLRAIAGQVPATAGRITLDGTDATGAHYRTRLAAGVHYMPADRIGEGLVPGLTITEHVALTAERGGAAIDWAEAEREAGRRIEQYAIRGRPDSVPESLSGGN